MNDFLKADFLPFAKTKHASKPSTHRYYQQGADMLQRSSLGGLRLDEITDQHAHVFAAKFSALSPSGINRGLRTLRRVLNLAYRWEKIEKPVKITLAQGERQRDRVLTEDESSKYIKACPQPWAECATTILDEAFRPSEVFSLRWPHLLFNQDETGLIQIVEGKSKAARRILPMTPRVYRLLRNRYEAAGCPADGWVFPSASRSGHLNGNAAKDQHKKALEDSCVEPFPPYVLRHTALTRLGEKAGGDVFVLARIAGHSSISVTQRYIHPQADAINRVFGTYQPSVGTKLGTPRKQKKRRAAKIKRVMALKSA